MFLLVVRGGGGIRTLISSHSSSSHSRRLVRCCIGTMHVPPGMTSGSGVRVRKVLVARETIGAMGGWSVSSW